MIGIRRDPSIVQRTVAEGKFTWLGEPLAGYQYGAHNGREYAVDLNPADPQAFVAQPGEILVSRRKREIIDGTPWETSAHHRAWPVQAGTHDQLVAKVRKPVAAKPMRSWDVLASLPALQRREPQRMVAGPATSGMDMLGPLPVAPSDEQKQLIAGAVELAERSNRRALIEVGGNEPPERTVAAMIAYLGERGIELTMARGHLVARSRTLIRSDLRDLIQQAEELLAGHLQGKPVMCSHCAEPAVTVVLPSAPMCEAHATGAGH